VKEARIRATYQSKRGNRLVLIDMDVKTLVILLVSQMTSAPQFPIEIETITDQWTQYETIGREEDDAPK
jgi:hypothetical protein